MGAGDYTEAPIDLNNGFVETVAFDRRPESIDSNTAAVVKLLESIQAEFQTTAFGYLYSGVARDKIVAFLESYINEDTMSRKSQRRPVLDYIANRRIDGELEYWDVLVARGDKSSLAYKSGAIELPTLGLIPRERRYPGRNTTIDALVVGEKHRLASRGVEQVGLTDTQIDMALANFEKSKRPSQDNISDKYYREVRTRPLLVVHPVLMRFSERQANDGIANGASPKIANWPSWDYGEPAIGWSISFPRTDKQTKLVKYVFNSAAMKNIIAESTEDTNDIGGDGYE